MIHGPCGSLNPSSPCMRDGACSKMYPKEFLDQTESGIDGYPHYRRRKPEEGGHHAMKTIQGEQITIDNRWVVPHSPYLCRVFNCHINVELCTSIKSIKYVLKYVHKGCDMAAIGLQNENNEIDVYQAARYVSCSEACWRLLNFAIHDHHPPVQTLQVHLQNGQRVMFTAENAHEVAEDPPKTTLTAFFELCTKFQVPTNTEATPDQTFVSQLLYVNVPEYFTFDRKKWKPRK